MTTGINKQLENHRIDFINSPERRLSICIKFMLKLLKAIIYNCINVDF